MVLSQFLDKSESVRLFLLWNTVGALFVNIVYDCVKMCRPVNPIAVVEMLLSTFSISRLHWSKKQKAEEVELSKEWEKKLQSNSHIFSFSLFSLVRESLPLLCPAIQSEVMWKSPSHLVAKLFYSSSLYLYSSVYPFLFLFSTLSNSLSLSLFLSMSLLSCSKYIRYYQTFLTPHR